MDDTHVCTLQLPISLRHNEDLLTARVSICYPAFFPLKSPFTSSSKPPCSSPRYTTTRCSMSTVSFHSWEFGGQDRKTAVRHWVLSSPGTQLAFSWSRCHAWQSAEPDTVESLLGRNVIYPKYASCSLLRRRYIFRLHWFRDCWFSGRYPFSQFLLSYAHTPHEYNMEGGMQLQLSLDPGFYICSL